MKETATLERTKVSETNEESTRCVVLLSGGIDSTVLMYSLVADYLIWPLTISYGQRHNKECIAARNVCEARNHNLLLRHKHLNLSALKTLIHSALHGFGEIPEGHYTAESQAATVSPNRNMIFLAVAAGYAQTIGAGYVAYAAHSNDRAIYPDCRPEFIRSVGETIKLGTGGEVELLEPFVNMTKADIVKLGKKLNVPFRSCWSCYKGEERPCLRCGTCVERVEAFKLAGFPDPALTAEEWSRALEYLEGCERGPSARIWGDAVDNL